MKKVFAGCALVAVALIALAGCNEAKDSASNSGSGSSAAAQTGKVLNIRCWNDEFQGRFRAYSSLFVKTNSDGSDTLTDGTTLKWSIVATEGNAYQNALDKALAADDSAAADDKVDLFLVEADYAMKYTQSPYALDVQKDIGLTSSEMINQYQYTKDIVTGNSAIRGVTWQATPGLYAYRRDVADDVLGYSDPTRVQAALSTWDKFDTVAAAAKAKGYYMLSGFDDAYRPFSNNSTSPWVKNKVVSVDPAVKSWADRTKDYTTKGYNHGTSLWSDDWKSDQGPAGKVFGFFYSTWGINFTLIGNADPSGTKKYTPGTSLYGDYAVVEGPASYYWGGTWLCAAKGTDNVPQVKSIMEDLTCNKTIMKKLTLDTLDYTNNSVAMNEIAADTTYGSAFLGGQNHIALFAKAAPKINMANISAYDQGCNEQFQGAMKDYFTGTLTTYDAALAEFKTKLSEVYPTLTYSF